jgi:hypothetical protein
MGRRNVISTRCDQRGNSIDVRTTRQLMKYFELFTGCLCCPPHLPPLSLLYLPLPLPSPTLPSLQPLLLYFPDMGCIQSSVVDEEARARPSSVYLSYPICLTLFLPSPGNEEIENQLRRDKVMAKNEIKMLLLGAGESGKVYSSPPFIRPPSLTCYPSRPVYCAQANEAHSSRWLHRPGT